MARILQVCNTSFYLGRFLVPLVLELAARGHAVECVCEGGGGDGRLVAAGVDVHDFAFPRKASIPGFLGAIRHMRSLLRRGRYDCVDSHNRNASIVARVAAALERVPLNVYTAHGFYFHDNQHAVLRELTVWLEMALGRVTTFTLSQSAEDVAFAVRRGIVPSDRIAHIGNGIDTARFSPRFDRTEVETKLGLLPRRFRISTTGRIVKGKGFEDLLRAYAAFVADADDTELLIVGGNIAQDVEPFQRQFVADIAALGLEGKVRITGIVENVEEYLAASDLFVMASYREGMPRSLIEAMAMSLPCLATRIRGCREIVEEDVSGFLFPPGDQASLGRLMAECFRDSEGRARMGAQARLRASRDFSETDYVARQVNEIERLLAGADRAGRG